MLSRLATVTDCTTLITHHVGHGNSDRARGASGWEQGLDFSYVIKGTRSDLDAGRPLGLTAHKMRDGRLPPPVGFRLKSLNGLSLRGPEGGEAMPVTSAVIELAESPSAALPLEARVFQYIKNGSPGSSKSDVRDAVGGRRENVNEVLVGLVLRGAVEDKGTTNRHAYHATPGWRVDDRGEVVNFVDDFATSPTALAGV
jgi:hypothetical protein